MAEIRSGIAGRHACRLDAQPSWGRVVPPRLWTLFHAPHSAKYATPMAALLFGGHGELLAELRRVATQLQPDIEIVGAISPPFRPLTEEDEASFAQAINQAAPDFIGSRCRVMRMERWIIANQARYQRGVFLAVGDAFSLLTGRRRFAPLWMQRLGTDLGLPAWFRTGATGGAVFQIQLSIFVLSALGRPARPGSGNRPR